MYKINEVAKIANISTRTLRFYDEKSLLVPIKDKNSNYRYYSDKDINTLQQILFYKRLGFKLAKIKKIIKDPDFKYESALLKHRIALVNEKSHIDALLATIDNTIKSIKGDYKMKDTDKFKGFKEELITTNENKYGKEIKDKYGEKLVNSSYAKIRKMSKWEIEEANRIEKKILITLKKAIETENHQGKLAIEVCELHQKWIKMYWPTYTKEAHLNLVKMYTQDERFKSYYGKVNPLATQFLYEAMEQYLKGNQSHD